MDAVKLSKLSFEELHIKRAEIEKNGINTNTSSFYKYNLKSRKKLDAITWAITYKLQEKRRNKDIDN